MCFDLGLKYDVGAMYSYSFRVWNINLRKKYFCLVYQHRINMVKEYAQKKYR